MSSLECDEVIENVLSEFGVFLQEHYGRRPATVENYVVRTRQLLKGQYLIDDNTTIDIDSILKKLSEVKYKNHFSQHKNALLKFCEFKGIILSSSHIEKIKHLERATKKKYKKTHEIDYRNINKKIDNLKNENLKLCYQVMMVTGLRVFEIEQITHEKCTIEDDKIIMYFIGKGNVPSNVELHRIDYLKIYDKLKTKTEQKEKLFYSAVYLQRCAKKMGFECHDLRRIFARLEFNKTHSKKYVQEVLRHSSRKNTNLYLRSRIKF